ncbi:hypothetical protein [Kitasatospora sp. NPDC056184]|uniref:hypothetical protein n=1 Tax=Kitasatospora sp. NPDC056184 TaxID=3345738 RepID=UPI0035DD1DEF
MIRWVRARRRRRAEVREAAMDEEFVVVRADGGEPLAVVFEPMGSEYEVPAGGYLTIRFMSPPGTSGSVKYRSDYASAGAAVFGTMAAWTAEGAEIDLVTGCPDW